MSDEQFKALTDRLDKIIELLEKVDKPVMVSVVNQRGLPGQMFLSNTPYDSNPPLIDAIGQPLKVSGDPAENPPWGMDR